MALCATGVLAEDYSTYLQMLRSNKYNLDAVVSERFVKIDAPAEWWALIDKETFNGQDSLNHTFTLFAGAVTTIATNMGWGDLRDLDRNNGYDGSSPLLAPMMDSWNGKIQFHVVISCKPDPKSVQGVKDSLDRLLAPFCSTYYFKPRGGKAMVNVNLDAKASKMSCKVSKDGNTYDVVLPVYATYSQSDLETALKRGM